MSDKERKRKRLNYYYIIYEAESVYKLPVGIFDRLEPVASFFGMTVNNMACLINRRRRGKLIKPFILNRLNRKFYFLKKWQELEDGEMLELLMDSREDPDKWQIIREKIEGHEKVIFKKLEE